MPCIISNFDQQAESQPLPVYRYSNVRCWIYKLAFGIFFLVAAKTAVSFIARFIFPLIFSFPFINACWGFNAPVINFVIFSDSTITVKSAFSVSPFVTEKAGPFKSKVYTSSVSEILNTTMPYTVKKTS